MRSVAIDAARSQRITPLGRLAVQALRVVLEDLILRDVMRALDGRALMVTAPAQPRNLSSVGR